VYPNLTPPLLALLGVATGFVVFLLARGPVLRKLAARQISRRLSEATLVVIGSTLGTAIIVGSLIVGDTLNRSVKQDAYRSLGPIDEQVVSTDPVAGELVGFALANLRSDPRVDGVLTAHAEQAAAVVDRNGKQVAQPRTIVWDTDFALAQRFGGGGASSGLIGSSPAAGEVAVNDALAGDLRLRVGDVVTFYLYDKPTPLRVVRVLPAEGLAGAGLTGTANRVAFVAPDSLITAAAETGTVWPRTVTFVSNTGGVESGNVHSDEVAAEIRKAIEPLSAAGTAVETPKKDVLSAAKKTGDTLGSLFLFMGSFSIIAGVLLLVNIFVMLGEERKNQLGMLRAVGMKRSRLVGSFVLEGAAYALVACVIGTGLGIGVGRAVASIASSIFRSWSQDGSGLDITFSVTRVSLFNGFAMGLLIALATVLVTSMRISRLNIITAIRDLPSGGGRRARVRWLVVAALATLVFTVWSVFAVARGRGADTYLMPALALLFAVPLLSRVAPRRWVYTGAAGAVLVWSLTANLVRPHLYDDSSMTTYIVLGVLLTFAAVLLVSENQNAALRPLRPVIERPTEAGLATRLAVAFPLARKFRTGATLVMYSIVVFTIVLITQINAIISASVDGQVREATAGYSIRVDYNPNTQTTDPPEAMRTGSLSQAVEAVAPLTIATAGATDPGGRTTAPLHAVAVGLPQQAIDTGFKLQRRLPGYTDDKAVWSLVARDHRYVMLDASFGSGGGPPGAAFKPGDTFWLSDPTTGRGETKTIAGVLQNGIPFYNAGFSPANAFPVVLSAAAVRDQFGPQAQVSSAFVRIAPGADERQIRAAMQGQFLSSSLVATSIRDVVQRMFSGTRSFFQLMDGFLALGLVVGITGLGVVMIRAVRERRRTIGVLRALGFRSTTVQRSFLMESSFVALEGILLGTALSLLTAWLLYRNSSAFEGLEGGFAIDWAVISLLVAGTFAASLLVTLAPARRAARIRPAIAVRIDN